MTMSLFRHTLTRRRDASASLVQLIVSSREQSSVTRPAEPSKVAEMHLWAGPCVPPVAEEDLALAMGSRGFGAVRSAVFGSTSHYVLNRADVPILVAREPMTPNDGDPRSGS